MRPIQRNFSRLYNPSSERNEKFYQAHTEMLGLATYWLTIRVLTFGLKRRKSATSDGSRILYFIALYCQSVQNLKIPAAAFISFSVSLHLQFLLQSFKAEKLLAQSREFPYLCMYYIYSYYGAEQNPIHSYPNVLIYFKIEFNLSMKDFTCFLRNIVLLATTSP
jgi:hypothetical protein